MGGGGGGAIPLKRIFKREKKVNKTQQTLPLSEQESLLGSDSIRAGVRPLNINLKK